MRDCKMRKMWRILILAAVFMFAIPVAGLVQEPIQAEAAAPKLNKKKASVNEGKTITLTVKSPTAKVKWSSSNSKVVQIVKKSGAKSSKATLKGVKKGTATITAKVGKKKLKAKVTVKHVHKWRGYATCTEPDKCLACGLTRGPALGHNFTPATCLSPATCQRCGAKQGGLGEHKWDGRHICSVCSILDIDTLLQMQITNAASSSGPTDSVIVAVQNNGRQEIRMVGAGSNVPISGVLTTGGRKINVYLYAGDTDWYTSYRIDTAQDRLHFAIESWDEADFFTVTFNATLQFELSYFNQKTQKFDKYLATVTPSGCSYKKL